MGTLTPMDLAVDERAPLCERHVEPLIKCREYREVLAAFDRLMGMEDDGELIIAVRTDRATGRKEIVARKLLLDAKVPSGLRQAYRLRVVRHVNASGAVTA